MRIYVVQPGDSPAKIAIHFVGCPKCAIDLVRANARKTAVQHPNGFVTFEELVAGERLELPDKWFSPEFEELPPSYFAALPHPDGVTPPKVRSGVVGDAAQPSDGLSTGAIAGLTLLGLGAAGGAIYLVTRPSRRRRIRRLKL